MSAPERIGFRAKHLISIEPPDMPDLSWTEGPVDFIRLEIHRAELAQVWDAAASLARKGMSTEAIRHYCETAAEALRGEGR